MNFDSVNSILVKAGAMQFCGWQIAEKGDWKNAKKLSPRPSEIESITSWVRQANPDVAIEALFQLSDETKAFFGIRLKKETKDKQASLIESFLKSVAAQGDFRGTLAALSTCLQAPIFPENPAFLEIGVFNLWKDVGSQVIFKHGQDSNVLSFVDIGANLQKEQPFPMMLEAAWKEPYPHWLGIPISKKAANGVYVLDKSRYETIASAALS